jgi:hypothetical protein
MMNAGSLTGRSVRRPVWSGLQVVLLLTVLSPGWLSPGGTVRGQQSETLSEKTGIQKASVTPDDRASAMQFAETHHPELAKLLVQLEKSRPGEFVRAVRDLNQQVQRLEKIRERTPSRYEEQLAIWKGDSQIRVLLARWSRNREPALETQIRDLLRQRRESRLARLKADQKRLEEQLARVNRQVETLSVAPEAQLEQEWNQLTAKAAPQQQKNDRRQTVQPESNPAAADSSEASASETVPKQP